MHCSSVNNWLLSCSTNGRNIGVGMGKPLAKSNPLIFHKALAKRSRFFTPQRSTCLSSEMLRAFGHFP